MSQKAQKTFQTLSISRWKTLSRSATLSCQSSHPTLDLSGGNCLNNLSLFSQCWVEMFWKTGMRCLFWTRGHFDFYSGTWGLVSTRQPGRLMLCPTTSQAVHYLRFKEQLRSGPPDQKKTLLSKTQKFWRSHKINITYMYTTWDSEDSSDKVTSDRKNVSLKNSKILT